LSKQLFTFILRSNVLLSKRAALERLVTKRSTARLVVEHLNHVQTSEIVLIVLRYGWIQESSRRKIKAAYHVFYSFGVSLTKWDDLERLLGFQAVESPLGPRKSKQRKIMNGFWPSQFWTILGPRLE